MTITASIDEHDAVTLTYAHMNTTSNLGVPDAAVFAGDLASTLQSDQADIHREGYNILVNADGLIIKVRNDSFDIPWQHITSVVAQLRRRGIG